MAPIICPKCGSENTTAIFEPTALANETTKQAIKQNDAKEANLLLAKTSTYHCTHCEKDFGGNTASLEKYTTRIYLTTHTKGMVNQKLTFSKTATGATFEGPFLCYYPELPELYVNHEKWVQLLKAFYALYIFDWETDYKDADSPYEFGWELKIKFEDQETVIIQGENQYSPYFDALMALFVSFGLPNIKNKLGQNFM
ncbi:MAG: hypothetical protein ACOH15_04205 [Acetobacterium sp.]